MPGRIDDYESLLTKNTIWLQRTQGVGKITTEQAVAYGMTGPSLRATGVEHDLRKARPYSGYENYDFEIPGRQRGRHLRPLPRAPRGDAPVAEDPRAGDRNLPDGPGQHRRPEDLPAAQEAKC